MKQDLIHDYLLGIDTETDCAAHRKQFKAIAKTETGIPLHLEGEAERRGLILADAYERLYDARKEALRSAGIQFSEVVRADDGGLATVNLAACLSIPVFIQALESGDGALFAVLVMHWMRASSEKEWVFGHLCEAVHVYYRCADLRNELGEVAEYAFDDLRDHLREALHQHNHRHC